MPFFHLISSLYLNLWCQHKCSDASMLCVDCWKCRQLNRPLKTCCSRELWIILHVCPTSAKEFLQHRKEEERPYSQVINQPTSVVEKRATEILKKFWNRVYSPSNPSVCACVFVCVKWRFVKVNTMGPRYMILICQHVTGVTVSRI